MKFLVIPSNRPENLREFFDAWRGKGGWDSVVVVHDSKTVPESIFKDASPHDCPSYHCDWTVIDKVLGDDAWIISREDSAIRSFGFLAAYHLGATSVMTLDDDCFPQMWSDMPVYRAIFDTHLEAMSKHRVWCESCTYKAVPVRTRGLPYKNLGVLDNVKVNMGLWTNNGDWDSVQSVLAQHKKFYPDTGNSIVPHGQMIPMCGMNLCFKREAIPLMYFPLQGKGWPYRRFDDIFCGIIAKTLMDRLGWSMSVGEPFVEHRRASDPEVNRVKEAPGLEANEWFWQEIKKADQETDNVGYYDEAGHEPQGYVEVLGDVMTHISKQSYVRKVGEALQVWSKLFNKKLEF